MDKQTTLWAGEIHHADCDPCCRVAALDKATLLQVLDDCAHEEWDFATDGDPDAEIDLRQSECQTTAGELGLSDREMAELEEDGYVYLEG